MKIEFLSDINEVGYSKRASKYQLVRLYEFDQVQAAKFRNAIQLTIIDNSEPLNLTKLDFIENINCNLIMRIIEFDIGITTTDEINFFCDLTSFSYKEMISLVEPFCSKDNFGYYQWLYNIDTPIEFLFSITGDW